MAKTLIARSFAAATGLRFGRVQFTPDLLPSDVTGVVVFDPAQPRASSSARARSSANLLLADEINRAPPKTQAALLEAMEERQVTVDGGTHPLERPVPRRSPPRTRSSTRAPTRCPRPSSTASSCACASATRRPTTSGACSTPARGAAPTTWRCTPIIDGQRRCAACRPRSRPSTSASRGRALHGRPRDRHPRELGGRGRRQPARLAGRCCSWPGRAPRSRAATSSSPDDVKAVAVPALAHRLVLRPELWVRRVDADDVVAPRARRRARPARDRAAGR